MKKLTASLVAGILVAVAGPAAADSVVESWVCTPNDGATIAEIQAANSKWLAWVHETVSEEITSSIATSLVGDGTSFMFVDSFPDVATWAATKKELETDAGQAAEALITAVATCTGNRLWNVQPTE